MRAAIYARYSSDLQRPSSIEDQVRRCRAEIAHRGDSDMHVFDDSEIPGMVSTGRPGYQRMLKAAKAHEFDVLIVDELSRLTRRPSELFALYERLQFWGVGLVSLLEGLDSIAAPEAARAIIALKSYTNEAEGQANAHRSRRGLEGRVLAGMHAGGAPYGYRTRPVHADKPGDPPGTGPVIGYEYLIHEGEAAVIRRIFQMYADRMSSRKIAALLNAEGVLPPGARWRDRQGVRRTWSHGAIHGDPTKGLGILNNEKYIGRLIWNRSTWPRDPEQDGKQVRRELFPDQWVTQDAPHLRIVPQELWDSVKARQRQRSARARQTPTVPAKPRLLSGLLTCGRCGGRLILRGRNTYSCASRQNRGISVCDCRATVNAVEAEQAILNLLEPLFCDEAVLARLEAAVRKRLTEARRQRTRQTTTEGQLRRQLAEVEGQISRLVQWIAKGKLVEDLETQMMAAEARRDYLRRELARARAAEPPDGMDMLPAAVRKIVSDLRQMLAAGRVEDLKRILSRLITRIEVHEDPRPGRKRPGAKLEVRGNLEALLQLTGKVESVGSPGGLLTPLTFQLPPRVIRLHRHQARPDGFADERRRAVGAA